MREECGAAALVSRGPTPDARSTRSSAGAGLSGERRWPGSSTRRSHRMRCCRSRGRPGARLVPPPARRRPRNRSGWRSDGSCLDDTITSSCPGHDRRASPCCTPTSWCWRIHCDRPGRRNHQHHLYQHRARDRLCRRTPTPCHRHRPQWTAIPTLPTKIASQDSAIAELVMLSWDARRPEKGGRRPAETPMPGSRCRWCSSQCAPKFWFKIRGGVRHHRRGAIAACWRGCSGFNAELVLGHTGRARRRLEAT